MKISSFSLFIVSSSILCGALLLSMFKTGLGIGASSMLIGAIATFAFGVSTAGTLIGIAEMKNSKRIKNWVGLFGNLTLVALFILVSALAFK